MKKTLIYFSATGQTKKVNDFFLQSLNDCDNFDITNYNKRKSFNFENHLECLIFSIPIHGQDIPKVVKDFIQNLKGNYAIINITFGTISSGKGLTNAIKILKRNGFKIIGASLIPTTHSYLPKKQIENELSSLQPLIEKLNSANYEEIKIPKEFMNPIAKFFPSLNKLTVKRPKIIMNKCIRCFECLKECPVQAINYNLKTNNNCIRCMRCVNVCKNDARYYKNSIFLTLYFKKFLFKKTKAIIYV